MRRVILVAIGGCLLMAPAIACAQFNNGGFETGDFTGWTVTPTANGRTSLQQVVMFDIDGPGALGSSLSARFSVGEVVYSGVPAGIELTQSLNLTASVEYTFSFNWAATRTITTNNAEGGIFDLIVNGSSLANAAAGLTGSALPHYGFLSATYTPATTGAYAVGARITRPYEVSAENSLHQNVDNFTMSPVPEPASMVALAMGAAALLRRRRR